MSVPDPGLPIPNDDPDCRCGIGLGEMPADAAVVTTGTTEGPGSDSGGLYIAAGQEFSLVLDPGCPHHGEVLRQVQQGCATMGLSIGASTSRYGAPLTAVVIPGQP